MTNNIISFVPAQSAIISFVPAQSAASSYFRIINHPLKLYLRLIPFIRRKEPRTLRPINLRDGKFSPVNAAGLRDPEEQPPGDLRPGAVQEAGGELSPGDGAQGVAMPRVHSDLLII